MTLTEAVEAAGRGEVFARVRAVYAALEGEIAERRPRCDASGRCCHFDAFGHRLYVTTAELALFVEELKGVEQTASKSLPILGACRFQVDGLCSVHAIRPFGCRIFFCDPTVGGVEQGGDGWMEGAYERHHGRIKALHEELGVPYMYVEWRAALAELGLGGDPL